MANSMETSGPSAPSSADTAKASRDAQSSAVDDRVDAASETIANAMKAAREATASAAEELDELGSELRVRLDDGIETLSRTVVRNPLKSIVIAAGIGLVCGLIVRPERR